MPPQECTISADGEGATSRATEADMKMQQIDETIQKRTEEMLALKIRRNEYAPISRLPVEIMQEIFLIVKELVDDESSIHYPVRRRWELRWIRVSHVTTAWRNIALEFVGLWTGPPIWNATWAEEMVRRSKGAALTIRHDLHVRSSLRSPQFLQEAIKNGENINELRLHYICEEHVGILPRQLSRVTNILLHCHKPHTRLPAEILSEASKLKVLFLVNCKIDLVSCLPHSITALKLDNVQTPSTFLQFLDALKYLSSLEVLHLRYTVASFESSHSSWQTINLPNLQRLSIMSTMELAAMFFRNVVVPPNIISLRVNLWMGDSPDDFLLETKDMLAAIGRIYADDSCNITFRALYLGQWGNSFNFFVESSCPLSLHIYTPKELSSFPTTFLTMLCSSGIPMDNISTVQFENTKCYEGEHLAQTLGRLPNVSHIKSNGKMAYTLLEAIQIPSNAEQLYFSNLSILELNSLYGDMDRNCKYRFFNTLRDCLMLRCEYDAEIIKLVLQTCSCLDDYVVEQLAQIVVDVESVRFTRGLRYDKVLDSMEEDFHIVYHDIKDVF